MTAVWTAPRTWVVGELVTAALMNTHVRDNLDWIKTPTSASATLGSNFATTSATMVDVTGASVTLTTNGGGVDVFLQGYASLGGIATATYRLLLDGVLQYGYCVFVPAGSEYTNISMAIHIPGLSAGSHTIKLQASTNSGTFTIFSGAVLYAVERGA